MTTDKKIVLIGDSGVGKTTMLMNMKTNEFDKFYHASFGAEVHPMKFDEKIVNVWDIGGQATYAPVRTHYYKDADAAVIVFDVTHKRSYNNVPKWYNEVIEARPDIPIVIIGNKSDDENRKIAECEYDFAPYYEMSVKNNENVLDAWEWLAKKLN
jgi:small GTP-binding protein